MVESAKKEAKIHLAKENTNKIHFFVASNENLHNELSEALRTETETIANSFHLIFGVNTFRYCHRLKKSKECSNIIYDMLVKGGNCIMIEMNNKYPFYLSRVKDRLTKPKEERMNISL